MNDRFSPIAGQILLSHFMEYLYFINATKELHAPGL